MKTHTTHFLELVAQAKQRIKEIPVKNLKEKIEQHQAVTLIDVREDQEWAQGHIPSAIHISKGTIERDIEKKVTDLQTPIVVYCSGGFRSALVADNLQNMGYTDVHSLETGLQGWIGQGYTLEIG